MEIFILIILTLIVLCFVLHRYCYPYCMGLRGKKFLYKKLFLNEDEKRKEVLATFHTITANRFTDKEAIDYFMKEKGLQLMSITPGTPLKLKYYLSFPTKVDLSYFEKVNFNEMFINYRAGSIKKV